MCILAYLCIAAIGRVDRTSTRDGEEEFQGRVEASGRASPTGIPDVELARRHGRLSALLNVVCGFREERRDK